MQFEEKIEKATFPLITDLRRKIALLPTIDVLNHYQYRINLSQFNKDKLPDGFWAKGRYVSGLLLANRYLDKAVQAEESPLTLIDELVEEIYDCYALGAVFEPGQTPGSETEFLTRLGVGLNVREPDALGFPEQFIQWAAVRFEPFNESYFLPVLGLTYAAIVEWLDRLSSAIESRLNTLIDVLRSIMNDVEGLREEFAAGKLSVEGARERSDHLKIGERMDANGRDFDSAHIFAYEDLKQGIPESNARILLEMFAIRPGDVPMEFNFPHDANPLDRKFLVHLPNANFYFLDPASAHRVAARVFENAILGDEKLRARYLRNRDRATEKLVSESARQVFLSSTIRANYYLEKGSHEKDLIVVHGRTLVLVECKNSRVRAFRGVADDLLKFESDFANSVQFGYDQAVEVKRRILNNEETTFFDKKGNASLTLKRDEVERIYIICVAITPRGPFGTNLSYELKKDGKDPFPLAVGLFDFQTICKHFNAEQLVEYLAAREQLHGSTTTGDELNYAGYFLKFGHLNLQASTFLTDDFSSIFDRKWYRERGVEIEEPSSQPVSTSMRRKGNRLTIEHGSGRKETIKVPEWMIERTKGKSPIKMKGSDRNKPCPCGSGLKLKHCCGVS